MQVKFLQNFGGVDARAVNAKFKTTLTPAECKIDCIVYIPDEAAEALAKKYPGLFEQVKAVRGVAKKPEVTTVAQ